MTDKAQPDQPKEETSKVTTSPLREETVPEELTGRATRTGDDLTTLFGNGAADHLADGFSGGSDDDIGVAIENDDGADSDQSGSTTEPE